MSYGQTEIKGGIEYFDCGDGQWDTQCARCGSSTTFVTCYNCGGDEEALGSDCIDDLCHGGECMHGDSGFIPCGICRGEGGWERCLSGPDWCNAHPLPGREHIKTTAYEGDDE